MALIEECRSADLHLDIRLKNPDVLFRCTPMTTEMQANLQQDVKDLVIEYLQYQKVPQPKSLPHAIVEIISEDTRLYIWQLETLLRHAANTTDDASFATQIDCSIRSNYSC